VSPVTRGIRDVPELVAGEVALPSKNDIVGRS
jgi:hypothetical protein